MRVSDVMEMAKASMLTNLVVSKNDVALMGYINLGVSELYRRFNLRIEVETILTNPDLALYELRSKNVDLLLSVYNGKGEELKQTDILGGFYDYKVMNYRSFLMRSPKNDALFAVYKASPERLTSPDDYIDLPDSMFDALLSYVGYMGHSTINKDNINEASAYAKRFDSSCQDLENQGYRVSLTTESISLRVKGYV